MSTLRRPRKAWQTVTLVFTTAAVAALVVVLVATPQRPRRPSPLLMRQAHVTSLALSRLRYSQGEWRPDQYFSPDWPKYQDAAVASAALGVFAAGSDREREIATATVDAAIAHHQLPDGDFDNGTPASGDSSVSGGFWAESEGLIAVILHKRVAPATLRRWERSMAQYVSFLERSGNARWYSNGNVVIRQTVTMLETAELARLVHDPQATTLRQEYEAERRFLVDPSTAASSRVPTAWRTYGEHRGTSGALWFDESPTSAPNLPISCANGKNPCDGFDANYTMAQLSDALVALRIGVDRSFWLAVAQGEYAALHGRVSSGLLNAAGGSRDDIPQEPFYPPVYAQLPIAPKPAERQWNEQLAAIQHALAADSSAVNANVYSLAATLALPLLPPED